MHVQPTWSIISNGECKKVTVKVTLKQAMKAYGEGKYSSTRSLTSALDRVRG
jgi:hypothetical protein